MNKHQPDKKGFVFSTDPHFHFTISNDEPQTLPKQEQKLRIWLDTKHRGGKVVTLINGFIGTNQDLQQMGKNLKNTCGTGGSAKDGEIIIQGDHREKILQWLQKNGYSNTKKAGG